MIPSSANGLTISWGTLPAPVVVDNREDMVLAKAVDSPRSARSSSDMSGIEHEKRRSMREGILFQGFSGVDGQFSRLGILETRSKSSVERQVSWCPIMTTITVSRRRAQCGPVRVRDRPCRRLSRSANHTWRLRFRE